MQNLKTLKTAITEIINIQVATTDSGKELMNGYPGLTQNMIRELTESLATTLEISLNRVIWGQTRRYILYEVNTVEELKEVIDKTIEEQMVKIPSAIRLMEGFPGLTNNLMKNISGNLTQALAYEFDIDE